MTTLYDKKFLIIYLLGFTLMVGVMRISDGAGFALILPCILLAAVKRVPETMLFLLVLSVSMLIGNPNVILKESPVFAYSQRFSMVLVAVVMITSVFGGANSPFVKPFSCLIPYLLWMSLVSSCGWCPYVSYLKLILFSLIFFACYAVANRIATAPQCNIARVRSVFLAAAVFFLVGSLALLPFPGISQLGNEAAVAAYLEGNRLTSLFMGMTFHSQTLGPVCAFLGTAIFADLVFGIRRADKLYLSLLACVPILIWKTSSRTAMGSFVVGIVVCSYFAYMTKELAAGWKRRVVVTFSQVALAVVLVVLVVPAARERIAGFVVKYDSSASISQIDTREVLRTRRGKWDDGIYYFQKSPVMGNGFQVSEDMQGLRPGLTVLSAPVEKSIWVSAILEEGGVPGLFLFSFFIICVFLTLKRLRAYIGLSMFLVFLVVNLGEFTIFSMSGFGGFAWVLVFVGISLDVGREQSYERFLYM